MKRFFWLTIAAFLLSLVGYTGYVVYPRFTLTEAANTGLLLLAVMAGVASLFSPCSFPLLLTLLARESSEHGRLLRSAGAFTVGAALFLLLTGTTLALGAAPLLARITFTSVPGRLLRTAVGLFLILLGLRPVRGRSFNFAWLNTLLQPLWQTQARLRRQHSTLSSGLYGFGYVLTGFGWTGPILAGLAGHALVVGGPTAAFAAFAITAFTIVFLMLFLAAAIGTAQEHVIRSLKTRTHQIKRWSGVILILTGLWLLVLAIWAEAFAQIFTV